MRSTILSLGILLLSTAAQARSYGIHATGLMAMHGVSEKSVHLEPGVAGWYLALDLPGDGARCTAELADVSPVPGHLLKWTESVPNYAPQTTVLLQPSRYLGSHTYHMTLRCGMRELAHGLIHLAAPEDFKVLQRFQVERANAAAEEDGVIAIAPKGEL